MRRVSAFLLAVLTGVGLISCADFKADHEDAKRSEADIKSELGVDSEVSFHAFSGTKGKRLVVTVYLKSSPAGDFATVRGKVREIVVRDFRANVDRLTVDF